MANLRNSNDIDQVLSAVREAWMNRPELRLGQLITIASQTTSPCPVVFSIEDSVLKRRLEKLDQVLKTPVKQIKAESNLVVIQAADMEKSKEFYSTIGFDFLKEKHGNGPEHYASEVNGFVFEIYPTKQSKPTDCNTRLGFKVDSVDVTAAQLSELGVTFTSVPANSQWGRRVVVLDPDGRKVELLSP